MIIGIDASRANQTQKTGVGWYAFQVIQELKKITPEDVRVVLYSDKPLQGDLAKLPEKWEEKVLSWPPFSFAQGKPWRLWTQIRLSWEMLIHQPDVLFIPAHVFPIIHPKKTVVTLHDIAAIRFPEAYNWFEKWYTVWSARVALKKLWRVITPSQFTKDELRNEERGTRNEERGTGNEEFAEKVCVIPHGYNKDYHQLDNKNKSDEVLEKYNIAKPYLLSVGRLEEKKNTINIIKSFEKLKIDSKFKNQNLKLMLVGMPGYGYEKVKEAIENSKFKQAIITPGWVAEEALPYLMQGAEVFVFPSLYEGFGIPVLEAMACGTPVVASGDNGSTKFTTASQEVGGGAAVYVNPESVAEISQTILDLLNNEELRQLKIKQGYARVEQFSWEKCARETLAVLLK